MTSQWQWQITVVLITCATWIHTEKSPLTTRDKSPAKAYSNHRMEEIENDNDTQRQSRHTLEFTEEKLREFREVAPLTEHYMSFSHHPSKDVHEKFPSAEIIEHQQPEPSNHGVRERNRNKELGQHESRDPQYYPRKVKVHEFHDHQSPLHTDQAQRHHIDDIISLEMRRPQGQREDPHLFHHENKNNFPMSQGTKQSASVKNHEKYPTSFPNGNEGNFKNNEKHPTGFSNGNEGNYNANLDNNPQKYFVPSEPYREFIPKHFRQEDGSNNEYNNYHHRARDQLMAGQNFETMNNGANAFSHDGIFQSQSNEAMRLRQNYADFRGEVPKENHNTFKISQHTKDLSMSPNMNNEHFYPHNSQKIISNTDKSFPYHQDPTIVFRPTDHEYNKQSQSRPKNNNGHGPLNFQHFHQMLTPKQQAEIPVYFTGSVRKEFQNGNNLKEGRRPNADSMTNPYFQEQGNRGITRPNTVLSGFRYDNLQRAPIDTSNKHNTAVLHTLREKPFFESNTKSANIQASPYYYRNGNRQIGFDENGFSAEGMQFIPSAKETYHGMPNGQRNHNKQSSLPNLSGKFKYGAVSSMSGPQQYFNTLQQPSLNYQLGDTPTYGYFQTHLDKQQSSHAEQYQMPSREKDAKQFPGNNVIHKGPGDLYNTDSLQQFHHMAGKPTHIVPMHIRHPQAQTMEYFNGGAKNHKYFNDPFEAFEQEVSRHSSQPSFYNHPPPQQYSYTMSQSDSTSVLKHLLPIGIIGTLGIAGLKLGLLKALFLSSLLKGKQNNISYSNYGTHYDGFEKIISSIRNYQDAQEGNENGYIRRPQFQQPPNEMLYRDSLHPLQNSQSNMHYISRNLPLDLNNHNHNFQLASIAQQKSQYKEEYDREEDWKKAMHID